MSDIDTRPFKERRSFLARKEESTTIRQRFPTKIPIIVERYQREKHLPHMPKSRFLVPQELTMSQFHAIVRNRMQLKPNQSFYLLVCNRSMANLSKPLCEIYQECRDEDGFLYVTYASQEMFGALSTLQHPTREYYSVQKYSLLPAYNLVQELTHSQRPTTDR